jgi:hypothetical protein
MRTRISCIFLSRYYILWLTVVDGAFQTEAATREKCDSRAAEQQSRRKEEF